MENLINELVNKKQEHKKLGDEIKALERRLTTQHAKEIENLENVAFMDSLGEHKVVLTYTRRLDQNKITQLFPPSTHSQIYKQVLDVDKFREHASPSQLEEFSKTSTSWRVSKC